MPKTNVTQAAITRTLKAVQAAGLPVKTVEVTLDGKVIVMTNDAEAPVYVANDWDQSDEKP